MDKELKIIDKRMPEHAAVEPHRVEQQDAVMLAIQKGLDPAIIERLMDLAERNQANIAKQAYYEAMACFKAEAPSVNKDKINPYFNSKYTSLGNLLDTYNPVLGKHGLSVSFSTPEQTDDSMRLECRISHRLGYSEGTSIKAPIDTAAIGKVSGQKSRNAIQDIKSTFTYLRSATLEAALGVSGTEASIDDDGNSAGVKYITDEQVKTLKSLIDVRKAKITRLLEYMGISSLTAMPAADFGKAIASLKSKPIPQREPGED